MLRLRTATLCLALAASALAATTAARSVARLRISTAAAVLGDDRPEGLAAALAGLGDRRRGHGSHAPGVRGAAPAAAALEAFYPESLRDDVGPATDPMADPAWVASDRREARLLVAREAEHTYFGDLLAAADSSLTRWPVRTAEPITYWIQPGAGLPEWTPANRGQVDAAFATWGASGIPLGFLPAHDSASADILVLWTTRFAEPISGKTRWTHDRRGWIRSARITLALHRYTGQRLEEDAIHALALHEIGHALGLDHTTDPGNVMAPRVRVRTLSERDVRTARLLYRVPPGRL